MNLQHELSLYLDTLVINSENIGDIRCSLFVPWTSAWNGIVRDETAARERCSAVVNLSPLLVLAQRWREEAEEALRKWPRGAILPSKKLRQCADQLEEILTGVAPSSKAVMVDDV